MALNRDDCDDFGRGKVNFLHTSQDGTVFWICAESGVDNTEKVLSLLSGFCRVPRPSHAATLLRGLGEHGKLGGCTTGTADPS